MTDHASRRPQTLTVEHRGIEHIEESQRHGQPSDQFTIRFSPVIYLAPIVVGGIGTAAGLSLTGSVIAIIVGNLLGAIGTAVCSAMGPRLGMPQLTMSRAAFGYYGNYLPAVLSTLLFIGYYTVGTILGAQSLAELFHTRYVPIAIIVAVLSTLIAMYGHDLLHVFGRWITWISVILLVAVTIAILIHGTGTGPTNHAHGNQWLLWLLEFTVVFGYTVSWAPYASDYSRYLPPDTRLRRVFGWSFGGLFTGTTWMMIVGAAVIALTPASSVLSALQFILPVWLLKIALVIFGIAALPHNAANLYSNAMTSLTWDLPMKRSTICIVGGAVGGVLAVFLGGDTFVNDFEDFLFLVTYYVTPWLAIICIDFYRTHRSGATYPPADEFYRPHGALGQVKWSGLLALLVGVGVSVPFMATNLYVGPIGHGLGGADLSYFVSFIVAGAVYLLTAHRVHAASPATTTAVDPSVP